MWTVGEVAIFLGLAKPTIRVWTQEFASYLSEDAAPQTKGVARTFHESDLRILYFVKLKRDQHLGYEDIHKALTKQEHISLELPDLEKPQLGRSTSSGQNEDMVPTTLFEQVSAELRGHIQALEEERNYLRKQLDQERAARLEAIERAARLETRLEVLEQ